MQTVLVFWRAAPFRLLQIVLVLGQNLTRFWILGHPDCIGVLPNLHFLLLLPLAILGIYTDAPGKGSRVFRDDSRGVRDFLKIFTGFCRFLYFSALL